MTRHAHDTGCVVRPARSADFATAGALVHSATAGDPYSESARYFLGRALRADADDTRMLVAERNGVIVGCALFGTVGGTIGTARLNVVVVAPDERRHGCGSALCNAVAEAVGADGARRVVAELPDDTSLAPARALMGSCGFSEVGRVIDYYRDGVDLSIMERCVDSA